MKENINVWLGKQTSILSFKDVRYQVRIIIIIIIIILGLLPRWTSYGAAWRPICFRWHIPHKCYSVFPHTCFMLPLDLEPSTDFGFDFFFGCEAPYSSEFICEDKRYIAFRLNWIKYLHCGVNVNRDNL